MASADLSAFVSPITYPDYFVKTHYFAYSSTETPIAFADFPFRYTIYSMKSCKKAKAESENTHLYVLSSEPYHASFGNASIRSSLCNIIVLIWPQDHLLETTWSPLFQAHSSRVQRERPSCSRYSCVFIYACLKFICCRCFRLQVVHRSVMGVTMTVCYI